MEQRRIEDIAVGSIVCLPQVRQHFDEEEITGLAQTVRKDGIREPIEVYRRDGKYIVITGERRLRAAIKAGLSAVPAIVEDGAPSPAEILQRQLIENIQRCDLSPLEKANGIQRWMVETKSSATQVAANLGLSNATVTRLLSLLPLPDAIKQRIASGEIPASAAYELAHVEDAAVQAELANQIATGRLTRDGLSGKVKARKQHAAGDTAAAHPSRVTAQLGDGRSVTVAGAGLASLDQLIAWLEELLARARKARPQGVSLGTFIELLKDQARSKREVRP